MRSRPDGLPVSPERWQALEPLLDRALDLDAGARAAFVDVACGSDLALRNMLLGMIEECETPNDVGRALERPAFQAHLAFEHEERDALATGLRDRYVLQEVIGRGGMGTVYRAHDMRHDRTVAIKVLRPDAGDARVAARFLREIRVMAGLRHPRLLPLYDSDQVGGRIFYVMPHVAGGTLRDRLQRAPALSVVEAAGIVRDIAEALACAHARGVLHRDVKPENVLLDESGAVLADFGIASAIARATGTDEHGTTSEVTTISAFGTPAYMAPEQRTIGARVDHRADLYALGVLAFEMLAQVHPFVDTAIVTTNTIQRNFSTGTTAALPADLPPALAALVMRLMACDPDDRPSSAADVIEELETMELRPSTAASMSRTAPGSYVLGARERHPSRLKITTMVSLAAVALVIGAMAVTPDNIRSPRGPLAPAALDAQRPPRPVLPRDDSLTASRPDSGNGATAMAPIRATPMMRVLVAPMANASDDRQLAMLGRVVADFISGSLVDLDSVDVVPRLSSTIALSDDSLRAAAQRAGAQLLVNGSYTVAGDSVRVSVNVSEVVKWRVLASIPAIATLRTTPDRILKPLRERVMTAVAIASNRELPFGATSAPPTSFEAYTEYVMGLESFSAGRWDDALPNLTRAWGLDSSFVAPAMTLVDSYTNLGQRAAADSVLRIIERRRATLSMSARANVDRQRGMLDGDIEKQLSASRAYERATPGTMLPRYLHGLTAMHAGMAREALQAMRPIEKGFGGADAPPWLATAYWETVTSAHHLLGDYDRERASARVARAAHPELASTNFLRVRASIALGELDSATAGTIALAQMTGTPDRRRSHDPMSYLIVVAREFAAHGHPHESTDALHLALDAYAARSPEARESVGGRLDRVTTLYLLGEYTRADSLLAELQPQAPKNRDVVLASGLVGARIGDRERALRAIEQLEQLKGPYDRGNTPYAQAQLAAVLDDHEQAIASLQRARREGLIFTTVPHHAVEFGKLRNDPRFQQLFSLRR